MIAPIATLGGIQEECYNGLMLETPAKKQSSPYL
jgi:hypothetical protein